MSKEMRRLINEFEEFNKHRRIFTEAKLSRIWQYIQDDSRSFGSISAYRKERSEKENKENHRKLCIKVREMGYGYIELKGGGTEDGIPTKENSIFIPSIKKNELIQLAIDFGQDWVIYKDDKEFVGLSTNEREGIGTVVNDFIKNGWDKNHTFDSKKTKEVFSSLAKGSHMGRKWAYIPKTEYLYEVIGYTMGDAYRGRKPNDTDLIKLL
jgi:hypothetical protein